MAKRNTKEVLRTFLITQGQLCSNLGFTVGTGISMIGVSPGRWTIVSQFQIHTSVLVWGCWDGVLQITCLFVSSLLTEVLQMGPYQANGRAKGPFSSYFTCSFQCKPNNNLAAEVGSSL